MIGELAPAADCGAPPSLEAHDTVKPVIALAPFAFAVNETVAEFPPRVTPERVGALG